MSNSTLKDMQATYEKVMDEVAKIATKEGEAPFFKLEAAKVYKELYEFRAGGNLNEQQK